MTKIVKSKGLEEICYGNTNQRKAGVASLILEKYILDKKSIRKKQGIT